MNIRFLGRRLEIHILDSHDIRKPPIHNICYLYSIYYIYIYLHIMDILLIAYIQYNFNIKFGLKNTTTVRE